MASSREAKPIAHQGQTTSETKSIRMTTTLAPRIVARQCGRPCRSVGRCWPIGRGVIRQIRLNTFGAVRYHIRQSGIVLAAQRIDDPVDAGGFGAEREQQAPAKVQA